MRDRSSRPAKDCAVVERVGGEWTAMVAQATAASDAALNNDGSGPLLAVADSQTKMSDKLRVAADSVSTPGFGEALNKWADGAAKAAQLQRDAVKYPSTSIQDDQERYGSAEKCYRDAFSLVDQATTTLAQKCPKLPAILAPSKRES
ncbi:hypothetical protein ACAG26_20870 [Mycobacterium sp. pUA109]|uniref:hypothetical protein n=1 Tax=Mycobacterium sp. pUA109 TaxID=3238982 RepID=UPI00351B5477